MHLNTAPRFAEEQAAAAQLGLRKAREYACLIERGVDPEFNSKRLLFWLRDAAKELGLRVEIPAAIPVIEPVTARVVKLSAPEFAEVEDAG